MSYVLYVLVDPRDHRVRYVGLTTNPENRRARHRARPEPREHQPIANWKRKIRCLYGSRPLFVPVLSCSTLEELQEAEIAWIQYYRQIHQDLLNVEDGGNTGGAGMRGKKHTLEWRQKMSGRTPWNKGKKMSPEACARMSAASRGRKQSLESIAKRAAKLRGRIVSPATRAIIAEKARDRADARRPEVRAKIAATLRGRRPTDEVRAKLAASQQLRRKRERWSQVP